MRVYKSATTFPELGFRLYDAFDQLAAPAVAAYWPQSEYQVDGTQWWKLAPGIYRLDVDSVNAEWHYELRCI